MIAAFLDKIRALSPLSFAEYMQMALYDPEYGYYSAGLPKIGHEGDFITAPELTPLFGATLANQCAQVLQTIPGGDILEFGAGRGQLCIDILTRLEALNCLPERYFILEVSGYFQQVQSQQITQKIPHLASRVQWLNGWPETPISGVMLANEVLDAMPVHRFITHQGQIYESQVSVVEESKLKETWVLSQNQRLLDYLQACKISDLEPYCSEVNLFLSGWLQQCYASLKQGAVLLIDYGFPRHEYYHPDRGQGTIMCHRLHHAHPDPFVDPGEQDITAHVDFTHVAEAAQAAGFHVSGFTNQASFLLANGLLSLLEEIQEERHFIRASQAVKQLVQPSEMGELFKVLGLTKAWDQPLNGFLLHDKRASL